VLLIFNLSVCIILYNELLFLLSKLYVLVVSTVGIQNSRHMHMGWGEHALSSVVVVDIVAGVNHRGTRDRTQLQ